MSSADFVVPFGIRILEDGTEKTVYLDDIGATEDDVAANYGRRCGLVWPGMRPADFGREKAARQQREGV